MHQVEGFERHSKENLICGFKKSRYRMKQSRIQWYRQFYAFIINIKYICINFYYCVYFNQVQKTRLYYFVILVLQVDNILVAEKKKISIDKLKMQLNKNLISNIQILVREAFILISTKIKEKIDLRYYKRNILK